MSFVLVVVIWFTHFRCLNDDIHVHSTFNKRTSKYFENSSNALDPTKNLETIFNLSEISMYMVHFALSLQKRCCYYRRYLIKTNEVSRTPAGTAFEYCQRLSAFLHGNTRVKSISKRLAKVVDKLQKYFEEVRLTAELKNLTKVNQTESNTSRVTFGLHDKNRHENREAPCSSQQRCIT